MLLSKCAVCDSKKSKFIKEQEASGLFSSLGIKAPISRILFIGPPLFQDYKMNKIVNKFSLAGNKFMPEMDLRQRGLTYSACGLFMKNKEKIQKLKQTRYSRYIYQNELDKTFFQHDMAWLMEILKI